MAAILPGKTIDASGRPGRPPCQHQSFALEYLLCDIKWRVDHGLFASRLQLDQLCIDSFDVGGYHYERAMQDCHILMQHEM